MARTTRSRCDRGGDRNGPCRADAALGSAPWRLRDLQGRDRQIAVVMFVLLLVAVRRGARTARTTTGGYPAATRRTSRRARSTCSAGTHRLPGLPSTSALYGDEISTNHPGPIEFYLLAVPLRVLGMSAGPLLTAAAINAACVLVALWVFFRRLGLTAMLWAGVLLLAVMWSAGTSVLTDTLSSNMTMYSLLCFGGARVGAHRRRPPAAAARPRSSRATPRSNISPPGSSLPRSSGVAVVALVLQIVIAVRARRRRTMRGTALRWLGAAAAVVAGVCWLPVADRPVHRSPRQPHRDRALRARQHPPERWASIRARPSRPRAHAADDLDPHRHDGRVLLEATRARPHWCSVRSSSWASCLVWAARAVARLARLALVALVLLGAGIINGSNVPARLRSGAHQPVPVDVYGHPRDVGHARYRHRVSSPVAPSPIRRRADAHPNSVRRCYSLAARSSRHRSCSCVAPTTTTASGRSSRSRSGSPRPCSRRSTGTVRFWYSASARTPTSHSRRA